MLEIFIALSALLIVVIVLGLLATHMKRTTLESMSDEEHKLYRDSFSPTAPRR